MPRANIKRSIINVLKLKAVKSAIRTFTIIKKNVISILENMVALSCLMNMEGTKNHELVAISKRLPSASLLLAPQDGNYCRVTTKGVECRIQQRIQGLKRLKRIEIGRTSVQENMQRSGYNRYRSNCIEDFSSNPSAHATDVRLITKKLFG